MTVESIEQDFRDKVSAKIRLAAEGVDRFRVLTPFLFDDGDHLAIVLRREGPRWVLSDEAHTYMHLTYDLDEKDLHTGTRQKIISNALSLFRIQDREGELVLDVPDSRYGDALYSFVQALLRISDLSYLSRERVKSTFMEDFRVLLSETVPEERVCFAWNDPTHDPHAMYVVDCRVNGMPRPLFVHALGSDGRNARRDYCAAPVREVGACVPVPGNFRRSGVDQPQGARALHRRMREAVFQCDRKPRAHQALPERVHLGMKEDPNA